MPVKEAFGGYETGNIPEFKMDACKDFASAWNGGSVRKGINKGFTELASGIEKSANVVTKGMSEFAEDFDKVMEAGIAGLNMPIHVLNDFTSEIRFVTNIAQRFITGDFFGFLQFIAIGIFAMFDPDGKLIGPRNAATYGLGAIIALILFPVLLVFEVIFEMVFSTPDAFSGLMTSTPKKNKT